MFIYYLFRWISNSGQLNLAYHKTNCVAENTIEEIIGAFEKEVQSTIGWFKSNKMIVNPNKF